MEKATGSYISDKSLSKYIKLGLEGIEVFRPKEIVKLHKVHEVYGDVSLVGKIRFDVSTIAQFKDDAFLILRFRKKKGTKFYTQTVKSKWFDDSRKSRLASAINWTDVFEGNEDEISFMKSELKLKVHYSYEALKEKFLESKMPSLRIKDIMRLIQIWVQLYEKDSI